MNPIDRLLSLLPGSLALPAPRSLTPARRAPAVPSPELDDRGRAEVARNRDFQARVSAQYDALMRSLRTPQVAS